MRNLFKLLFGHEPDDSERLVTNLDKLPPPNKKAMRRRERKAAEQIAAMKARGIYLAVPFRKFDEAVPANVTKIRKTA